MDFYGFYTGQIFDAHEFLGAHLQPGGTVFRTFAPGATAVELLLDGQPRPMQKMADGNFYELTVPDAPPGTPYEYRIHTRNGGWTDHCDPYGFGMELRPAHRSVVRDLGAYTFTDARWMRTRTDRRTGPLNIYEMHLGSWRRKPDGEFYTYDELAEPLADYLCESGYNYVEFLPLTEHPCDESWGYQVTGFFAPTSRYGTAAQLMALVDTLHNRGIGVIMDFVPAHFALDPYGLAQYDGTALYEYPHQDVGVSEWGSCNFMHSRGEVRSFLQSAGHYWLEKFHFDGLRYDAISRIIYWQGDERRGVNGNGVEFLRTMNKGLKQRHPGCLLAAEDSTSFEGVTRPAEQGGLGFDYKWDLGWMHDTLSFLQTDPACRPDNYHKLTFSMMYYYKERYLLPFSHDEVVHGKATILQKMNGGYDGKFPQGRALYLYMMTHPGKKLNFMGSEIGQLREWDQDREQDWCLRSYPNHDGFYHYIQALNRIYLAEPALWEADETPDGFAWLDCHLESQCVYVFERRAGNRRVAAAFNFSDRAQPFGVPVQAQGARALLYSDWQPYGGMTPEGASPCTVAEGKLSGTLAPFSAVLLRLE
ncbi:1,4-alpha-glucan branching protein GlgB [Gemmiger formicilis]|uniref:1,4-alpha-glucan branching protein GlgB n=1 Tax=Gemmiger formicilis TaxID=745368 RepID=UPI00195E4F25|nr:1,4-alpha-glucan branching protein GlgB [Gemmiger formicilis]MBM6717300.1 1,4-alpha-glucan branching protein GlgB [Gemmiger formicilis]